MVNISERIGKENGMRCKWKKVYAMLLAVFLTVTFVGNEELFVLAEEFESIENRFEVSEEIEDLENDLETSEEIEDLENDLETSEEIEDFENDLKTSEDLEVLENEMFVEDTQEVKELNTEQTDGLTTICTDTVEEDSTEKQILTYESLKQPEGVHVIASVDEGILPEGAYMVVSELLEGTNAYIEAEKTLADHNISFDGFKAMDITFHNVDDQIIELEEGSVQVHMTLDAQIFPEDIDPNTIVVQYHDTSKGGVQVETVADVTGGTVAVQEAEVVTEFSVNRFSTFTITWNGLFEENGITVKAEDKTEKEIYDGSPTDTTYEVSDPNTDLVDCDFTLSENDDKQDYEATCVVDQGESVSSETAPISNVTENTDITFANTKNIYPPTGIDSSYIPSLMMIASAGMTFIFVVFGKGRRF